MEETSKNNATAKLSNDIGSHRVSLKFWKESMIRNEMITCEKLINLLESREFLVECGLGRKWFDDIVELLKKQCKEHLICCAEELVSSKNYQ